MHDGTIEQGDSWLQQHLDGYVQWAWANNSLLIVTWDEDDFTSTNRIPTIFVGPMVQPGALRGDDRSLRRASHARGHVRPFPCGQQRDGLADHGCLGGNIGRRHDPTRAEPDDLSVAAHRNQPDVANMNGIRRRSSRPWTRQRDIRPILRR
jgi:hypothetical protein